MMMLLLWILAHEHCHTQHIYRLFKRGKKEKEGEEEAVGCLVVK